MIKPGRLFAAALLAVAACTSAFAQSELRMEKFRSCNEWVESHFAKGKVPPFSFTLDGRNSASFIRSWKYSRAEATAEADGSILREYSWTDKASGLQVRAEVKTFADMDVMEWTVWFKNTGSSPSGRISDIKGADVRLVSAPAKDWVVYHAKGSLAERDDFCPRETVLETGDSLRLTPIAGRSSNGVLPFFNVDSRHGGIVFALGWSGNWLSDLKCTGDGQLCAASGLRDFDAFLRPGEEVRSPLTAMIPWEGSDRMDGQNILRRFIVKHHSPKDDGGRLIEPPMCSSFNYGDPYPCNEYTCMTSEYGVALIHRYEQFGLLPDAFWLDAGWYEKAADWKNGWNWANAVGNWKPDPNRFPNGLGDISDAAHDAGCKFMVWFEPERVIKDSEWAYSHPEFLLLAGGGEVVPHEIDRGYPDSFLFNLGDEVARRWLTDSIIDLMKSNRIDYYRQDYNIDPEWFWLSNDEPGRKGVLENKYIQGLYAFWDGLREAFPGLLIDNCASGGRRLDLETTSRSIPLWRTDYNYGEPIGSQNHTYGLSQWLPASGTGTTNGDAFSVRSAFSAALIFNWSVTSASSNIGNMRKRIAEYRSTQGYFMDDFYPLTGYGDLNRDDIWMAYQLHRPSDGSGRIVAFRRDSNQQDSIVVVLRGLEIGKTYILEDQDSFERREYTPGPGDNGLTLTLGNVHSSLLINYWPKD